MSDTPATTLQFPVTIPGLPPILGIEDYDCDIPDQPAFPRAFCAILRGPEGRIMLYRDSANGRTPGGRQLIRAALRLARAEADQVAGAPTGARATNQKRGAK